jgi:hypothetical protein
MRVIASALELSRSNLIERLQRRYFVRRRRQRDRPRQAPRRCTTGARLLEANPASVWPFALSIWSLLRSGSPGGVTYVRGRGRVICGY